MGRKNKLVVPEAREAVQNLKLEIATDMGFPMSSNVTSPMYPALVNGLSVREMVRMGENLLIEPQSKKPSDSDIY